MKKNILKFILVLITAFGYVGTASAMEVVFNPNPLFSESNYLPGDEKTPSIIVNSQDKSGEAYLGFNNIVDNDLLSQSIKVTIKRTNDSIVYSGKLYDLFLNSPIKLDTFSQNQSETYRLFTSFDSLSANDTMNDEVRFDVWVSLSGEVITTTGGPGGGGGSGGGPLQLVIFNERVDQILPEINNEYDVFIAWQTTLPAGSQVVFGPVLNGPFTLDPNAVNFGYPKASSIINQSSPVLEHLVKLENLAPGEYFYRVVAYRDGLPSTSPEYRFLISADGEITIIDEPVNFGQGGGDFEEGQILGVNISESPSGLGQPQVLGSMVFAQEESPSGSVEENNVGNNISLGICSVKWWIPILIGLLGAFIFGFIQKRIAKNQKSVFIFITEIGMLIFAVFIILALFIALFKCILPYSLIAFGSLGILWFLNRK